MINPSDVYTGYGSTKLYGCWTGSVTKFDSSSFYNWEQDNLPIQDLDERTNFLWERLGHPASSVQGVALVVSGDSTDSCNSNIFKTLSSCLNTLPEVINCPYLIEVASYGDIGSLILSNKTFGPRGSIEIINRNFSKLHPCVEAGAQGFNLNGEKFGSDSISQNNGIASSVYINYSTIATSFVNANSSYSSAPCIPTDFKLSKVLSLNQLVTSSNTYDSRITGNLTLFTKQYAYGVNRVTAALATTNSIAPFTGYSGDTNPSGVTRFLPYDLNKEATDATYESYDVSTYNGFDDSQINWKFINETTPATTIAYTNRLKEIKVYNCNGPIFIRNFTVDGGGAGGRDYGIDIRNSSVLIENCSVARANKAGLYADNSKIILTRGFVAYRNYGFDNGVRIGTPYNEKYKYDNLNNDQKLYAAGIELNNSELNFSSTFKRDLDYSISASQYFYKTPALSAYEAYGWMFCLSRNDIGLKANNSKIYGGRNQKELQYTLSSFSDDFHNSNLISELNTEAGILLNNSELDYSGRLSLLGNFRGLNSINSNLNLDQIVCRENQKEGLLLNNSNLKYNKDCYSPDVTYLNSVSYRLGQLAFFTNGTHVKLINSTFEPTESSSMPENYGRCVMASCIGALYKFGDSRLPMPNNIVESNSKLRIVGLQMDTQPMSPFVSLDVIRSTVPGMAISVTNNSELTLQGTKNYITKINGISKNFPFDSEAESILWDLQRNKSGLYAGDNSKINLQGPTLINQFGIDILVDNNSTLEITPHKNKDNRYEVEKFNLSSPLNHTIVELHSSRSCIVANNNSNVIVKDLGNFKDIWGRTSNGLNIINTSGVSIIDKEINEPVNYGAFTSSGCLQFYPNPNSYLSYSSITSNDLNLGSVYDSPVTPTINSTVSAGYILSVGANYGATGNSFLFSSVTRGGTCVRALGSSKIEIDNVHFPCGWWNASGVIYETTGTDAYCGNTFIWNIADNSILDAKFVSVSGSYPGDVNYFGPSGTWGNASGAPAGTPDTGTVSILDYYGAATNHNYGSVSAQNRGPFRIYFSVDPAINNADGIATTGLIGFMPQVYAQGYQFSGNLNFSGIEKNYYKSILYPSSTSSVASGFYYASSMVSDPRTVNIILDESAANIFANAKHNSVGKSGLAKKVSIYFPYYNYSGGEGVEGAKNRGDGFKSSNIFNLDKDN